MATERAGGGGPAAPVGVLLVQNEGAPDNLDPEQHPGGGWLPFRAGAFDLVSNRYEAYRAEEVARMLRPGGSFITQQVDLHSYDDFYGRWTCRSRPDPKVGCRWPGRRSKPPDSAQSGRSPARKPSG